MMLTRCLMTCLKRDDTAIYDDLNDCYCKGEYTFTQKPNNDWEVMLPYGTVITVDEDEAYSFYVGA